MIFKIRLPVIAFILLLSAVAWSCTSQPDIATQPNDPSEYNIHAVPHAPPIAAAHAPPRMPPLEEMISESGAVVRVQFIDAEARVWEERKPTEPYVAYMALKFKVLEYLKGGAGLDTIWGGLGLEGAEGSTKQEALDKAKPYLDGRNTSLDNREAVIIFQQSPGNRDDLYSIGWLGGHSAENPWRRWLPSATLSGGVSGASEESQFSWDRSSYHPFVGASGASEGTVSLSELRALDKLSDDEIEKRNLSINGFAELVPEPPPATGLYMIEAFSTSGKIAISLTSTEERKDIVGYKILRRKQEEATFVEIADIPVETYMKFLDAGVEGETEYTYIFRAYTATDYYSDAELTITTVADLEALPTPATSPTPAHKRLSRRYTA